MPGVLQQCPINVRISSIQNYWGTKDFNDFRIPLEPSIEHYRPPSWKYFQYGR